MLAALTAAAAPLEAPSTTPRVLEATIGGPITVVVAEYIDDVIERAEREHYDAVLLTIDTPGGLVSSMRSIVDDILRSEVPVLAHVAPTGARAASAGAMIVFSASIAAMAPATVIGAATPVGGLGGEDLDRKVVNDMAAFARSLAELRGRNADFAAATVLDARSATAREAVDLGAIDIIAATGDDLLSGVHQRVVNVGPSGRSVTLNTRGAVVDHAKFGTWRSIRRHLADPNIVFLFLALAIGAIIYELLFPGWGIGGLVGAVSLLIALYGLAVLPVDAVGMALVLLGAALLTFELFAPGSGVAAVAGTLAIALGGAFLFDETTGVSISRTTVVPVALALGALSGLSGWFARRARRNRDDTMREAGEFIDRRVQVSIVAGRPMALIEGRWWAVRSTGPRLCDGAEATVKSIDSTRIVVRPLS